jgi:hypothetical protein
MANASNGLLYDDQTAIAGPVEGAWNHTALGLAGIMDLQPENAGDVRSGVVEMYMALDCDADWACGRRAKRWPMQRRGGKRWWRSGHRGGIYADNDGLMLMMRERERERTAMAEGKEFLADVRLARTPRDLHSSPSPSLSTSFQRKRRGPKRSESKL